LPFELLVARVAELGDGRVAAQLACSEHTTVRAATGIVRGHRVVLTDQDLSAVARARFQIFVAAGVVELRDRSVANGSPLCVRTALGAAAGHGPIQAAMTGEQAIFRVARRAAFVVRAARVTRFVAAEITTGAKLARAATTRTLARRLDELSGLASQLSLRVDAARFTFVARATNARLAARAEQQRAEQERNDTEPQSVPSLAGSAALSAQDSATRTEAGSERPIGPF